MIFAARFTLLVGAIAHQRVFNVAERRQHRLTIVQHRRPSLRARHLNAGDQPTAPKIGMETCGPKL